MKDLNWVGELGIRIETPITPISGGAGVQDLFTITGGWVMITQLYGVITTVIGAGPSNSSLEWGPGAGTLTVLATPTATNNYAEGDLLGLTGNVADALLPAASGGALQGMAHPFVLKPGNIELRASAANTGNVRWVLFYVPLDLGAWIEAS